MILYNKATGEFEIRRKMNRSAVLANIGFVLGTGRANPSTEDSVFSIVGAEDWAQFKSKLRSASDDTLRQILRKINELQPGSLPAGWETSAQ
jgi:hypothetical protein